MLKELKTIEADPQVTLARFTPCGKYLLAASYDARIRRWDLTEEAIPERAAIEGHGGWTTALTFAADGEKLFSADSWGQLRCGPYAGDMPPATWQVKDAHDGWIRDVAVSGDGQRVATCGIDKRVRIWSAADGSKQLEFALGEGPSFQPRNGELEGDVARVQFAGNAQTLLTADLKGFVKLWDLEKRQVTRQFDASVLFKYDRLQDTGGIRCLAMDGESKWLAVGGTVPKNGGSVTGIPTVLVFDFASGELKHTLALGQPNDCFVSDLVFHPRGFLVATTSGTPGSGQMIVQKLGEKEPAFQTKKMVNCQSVTAHPDGERIAVVATNAGSNGNGRPLNKDGTYVTNKSPIFVWKFEAKEA